MLGVMYDISAVYAIGVAFGRYAYNDQRIAYRRRAESETGHRQLGYTENKRNVTNTKKGTAMEPAGWATTRKYRSFMM